MPSGAIKTKRLGHWSGLDSCPCRTTQESLKAEGEWKQPEVLTPREKEKEHGLWSQRSLDYHPNLSTDCVPLECNSVSQVCGVGRTLPTA